MISVSNKEDVKCGVSVRDLGKMNIASVLGDMLGDAAAVGRSVVFCHRLSARADQYGLWALFKEMLLFVLCTF